MALIPYGFEGTLGEGAWAALAPHLGIDRSVDGHGGYRVVIGGGTRAVTIERGSAPGAGGIAQGWGVAVLITANEVRAANVVSSGTRWDTVALRRNWQPAGGGTVDLVIVEGGSTPALAAGLRNTPGVICDQPLALIRVTTATAVQEVINLRSTAQKVETYGTAQALSLMGANAPYGSFAYVEASNALYVRRFDSNGVLSWINLTNPSWSPIPLSSGFVTHSTWVPRYRRRLGEVQLRGAVARTNGGSFGTATNGAIVATLPAGFRPPHTQLFATAAEYDAAGQHARIEVRTTGDVVVYTPSAETHLWVGLDGVTFAADEGA